MLHDYLGMAGPW